MDELFDFFADAHCGYAVCDSRLVVRRVNRMLIEIVGRDKAAMVGCLAIGELFDGGGRIFFESHVVPVLLSAGRIHEIACNLVPPSGEPVPCLLDGRKISDDKYVFAFVVIRERRKYERELQAAKSETLAALEAADEASRSKALFFASMSHEIRTPLNAIIGFADVMSKELFGPIGNAKYRDYVADICGSGRHLLGVIDEILEISRIDSGMQQMALLPVEVGPILDDVFRIIEPISRAAEVPVMRPGAFVWPRVAGDRRCIVQVLLNLLSNAIKVSRPGDKVVVAAAVSESVLSIHIKDSGPGFSTFMRKHFGEIYAQDRHDMTLPRGTGLGLAISKKLALAMNGELLLGDEPAKGEVILRLRIP